MRWAVLAALALLMAAPAFADQETAVKAVRGNSRVIDAQMDNSGNLYAFVKADSKVPWDQVGTYLCQVVKPHQARVFKVRVIDVTKANFSQVPANWPRLGEADCGKVGR
jgi:hypothetical protein